jgi:hypothetical protein
MSAGDIVFSSTKITPPWLRSSSAHPSTRACCLDARPDFLHKSGLLNKLNELPQMTYAVIARDHIGTVETGDTLLAESMR